MNRAHGKPAMTPEHVRRKVAEAIRVASRVQAGWIPFTKRPVEADGDAVPLCGVRC
jgi:hypothetical protein